MKKLKRRLRFLLPWLLLGFLGMILFMLYLLSTNMNSLDRNRVELNIRQLLALNTQIDHDVLRLRYRQLMGYDSLTTGSRKIEELLVNMETEFAKLDLQDALSEAKDDWNEKASKLDDFKRHNSVLVNSLYHFINLANQLQALDTTVPQQHLELVNAVVRYTLVFVSEQQSQMHNHAVEAVDRLDRSVATWKGTDATLAKLLVAHAHKILNNHLPVNQIMRDMSRNGFAENISVAYQAYIMTYFANLEKAERYRKLMAVFSLVMIITVLAIVLRLQHTAQDLAESHSLLNNIADHLSEGILGFDGDRRLMFINRQAETLLQRASDELIGRRFNDVLNIPDRSAVDFVTAILDGSRFNGEVWLKASGSESQFPALFLGGPLPSLEGLGTAGYVVSFRDVTAEHEAEARLRLAARVFDNLSEAMTVAGADGRIQSINPAFAAITGYSEQEAIGKVPGQVLGSGQHDNEFFKSMWATLKQEGKWRGEIINRRKNGELFPEWLSITSVRDQSGKVEQYIALFSDMTDRKQAEAHIHHLAYHDSLTGLANRMLFGDRLNTAIHQAHRAGRPLAVVFLDLDRFKSINDSLGHPEGDKLLKQVGKRLEELLREGDTLARFGGDEFAILLPEIDDPADAAALARRILRSFEKPFLVGGHEVFSGTSVGIAIYPNDAKDGDILLKHADVALYNAKNAGRSTYQFFQESKSEDFLARLELETALRHAVDRNELRLYYQPQVSSQTQKIYGVEALVRWQHPALGLIPPDRFIPLAESTGYIDTLGIWCLETACNQFVQWQKTGVPIQRIAVNVSVRQLKNPHFMDTVLDIVKRTEMPLEHLELEMTESSMTDNPERVMEIFAAFRAKGIRIAIDDFGTGYSSLSYLARFPVDVLKIDKSFVQAMDTENDTTAVVRAIAVLAHSLSMEIVAEGIETEPQRNKLTAFGVELLQGYLYSRPVPNEKLIELPCVKG
ncbi:hypothetical protein AGMMS50229_04230 [Campylobacterota bacterium]|nr:hypothetical protein AGMMS50229_04230 [Campylobacterota bacterium]